MEIKNGTLYVVATPIGNLADITFRAIEVLKGVDVILAEDTRYTARLLQHYDITTRTVSYRDQNHERIADEVLNSLRDGLTLALVSDSGTPLISDPGYKLVSLLRDEGFAVESIPGPSAVTAALSISGLPTDKFVFLGFLPKSEKRRGDILKEYGATDATLVIYESPNRLVRLLRLCSEELINRKIAVVSDISKMYEKVYHGSIEDVLAELEAKEQIKGEYVVIISKLPSSGRSE